MRCLWTRYLLTSTAALLACAGIVAPWQDAGDERAIRATISQFFTAYAARDLEGYSAYWSPKSPDLSKSRSDMKRLFESTSRISISKLSIRRVDQGGNNARVRVRMDVNGVDVFSGGPAQGLGTMDRTVQLILESGQWRVWKYYASQEDVAQALMAAKTDGERASILESENELVTSELCKILNDRGWTLREQGSYAQALETHGLAQRIAEQIHDRAELASALKSQGDIESEQGRHTNGLAYQQRAVAIYEEDRNKRGVANTLNSIGVTYYRMKDAGRAADAFEKSVKLAETAGDRTLQANSLTNLATVYGDSRQFDLALATHERAAKVYAESGNRSSAARVKHNMGLIYRNRRDFVNGLKYLQEALAEFRALNMRPMVATGLRAIGAAHALNNEPAKALQFCEESADLYEAIGDLGGASEALSNLGASYFQLGHLSRALDAYKRSQSAAERAGDRRQVAKRMLSVSSVLRSLNNYEGAITSSNESMVISEELRDRAGVRGALDNMAIAHLSQGNLPAALECYHKAMAMRPPGDSDADYAALFNNMGAAYAELGDDALALEYFRKALSGLSAAGADTGAAEVNIARQLASQGRLDEAVQICTNALLRWEGKGARNEVTGVLIALADMRSKQKRYDEALALAGRALALHETTGDKSSIALALNTIGRDYRLKGEYARALFSQERALKTATEGGVLDLPFSAYVEIGHTYKAQRRSSRASEAYRKAIQINEQLREEFTPGDQQRQQFLSGRLAPYQSLAEIFIVENRAGDGLAFAERSHARALLDVLGRSRIAITPAMTTAEREKEKKLVAELVSLNSQVRIQNDNTPSAKARLADSESRLKTARHNYDQFQALLYAAHPELRAKRGMYQDLTQAQIAEAIPDSGTVLLEYVVGPEGLAMFAVTRDPNVPGTRVSAKGYIIKEGPKEVERRVRAMREDMSNPSHPIRSHARWLYDHLVGPAAAALRGKSRLIIIPDGVLWDLPFQALMTVENRYLIEDKEISLAPSIAALLAMRRTGRSPAGTHAAPLAVLAIANPSLGGAVQRTEMAYRGVKLGPLPEAEREANALSKLYGAQRCRIYAGAEADEDRVKRESGRARILHLATHGVVTSRSPLYSHLVLSPGAGKEDGLLEAWEVMELKLNADLVVLSACETARGRITAGEGAIGLCWAFFVAGCPTTLASQWKVSSASTSRLMGEFHRRFRDGATAAGAMRHAARTLMRDREFRHPFYWAGFVVTGDGERRFQGR